MIGLLHLHQGRIGHDAGDVEGRSRADGRTDAADENLLGYRAAHDESGDENLRGGAHKRPGGNIHQARIHIDCQCGRAGYRRSITLHDHNRVVPRLVRSDARQVQR